MNKRLSYRPLSILSRGAITFLFASLLVGCSSAHFFVNPRNDTGIQTPPYYLERQSSARQSDDLLVMLAFSGGGMRATALSYGVLDALRDIELDVNGSRSNLLNEVDLISSVSGGSFTAAYFGLNGYRIFDDFEEKFVRANIERELIKKVISPRRWYDLGSDYYDRSEVASDYYDKVLFKGATFSDLAQQPGPAILINSTDLTLGTGFGFHQQQFDWMCSSIADFPISRAVTASSAVPGLFSAVTVFNYGSDCEPRLPHWMGSDIWRESPALLPYTKKINAYRNSVERPYIHLMDGGLADNLGLRALVDYFSIKGTAADAFTELGIENTKKVVVIVTDAAAAPSMDINKRKDPPSTFFTVDAATTVQISLYNQETIKLFKNTIRSWQEQVSLARCGRMFCKDNLEFYFIKISLADIADEQQRKFLQEIPTTFSLEKAEADGLINAAEDLLEQSDEFKRLMKDLQY